MNSISKMKMKLITKLLLLIGFIGYLGYLLLGMGLQAHAPLKTQITFTSNRDRDGNDEIYVMDEDGKNIKRLTKQAAFDWISGPRWSPDGRKLLFYALIDPKVDPVWGRNWDIYTIDADGKNLRQLTNHPASERYPAWSPDGTQIAFTLSIGVGGGNQLYVMDVKGGNRRRLTDFKGSFAIRSLSWSPDSQQIIFSLQLEKGTDIYVIDRDGTNLRAITDNFGIHAWGPRWFDPGLGVSSIGLKTTTWGAIKQKYK